MRGTIIEHVPGSHLRLSLATGEERRFDADEIQWAGPASEMPASPGAGFAPGEGSAAAPPADYGSAEAPDRPETSGTRPAGEPIAPGTPVNPGQPVARRTVPVRFEADREGVRVDLRVGTRRTFHANPTSQYDFGGFVYHPAFRELCMAPCTQEFSEGRFRIGVALGDGGRTYPLVRSVVARGPTLVRIHWGDRYAIRVIGAVIWAVLGAAGTGFLAAGGISCIGSHSCDGSLALMIGGGIGVGVATAIGMPMALLKDDIDMELAPLAMD
ncbi:MAG TPA: hypothetical protein RMH99_05770 [Sandaracinaceae bacterium LLY-WYZ-13_1]|nr:hypothetical protein [Sandaracinaceae bacterium LLY-WYZ-13_1]